MIATGPGGTSGHRLDELSLEYLCLTSGQNINPSEPLGNFEGKVCKTSPVQTHQTDSVLETSTIKPNFQTPLRPSIVSPFTHPN
jgi:hypothetical protein